MELEEQKALEVLRKIMELNEQKRDVAMKIEMLTGKLCGISAEVGQLQALLKPVKPCAN